MKASLNNEIIMLENRLVLLPGSTSGPIVAAHEGTRMKGHIRVPDVTGTMDDIRITDGNVGFLAPVSMNQKCLDNFHIYACGDVERGRIIVFFRKQGAYCLSVPIRWDIDWDYAFNCMYASGTIRNGERGTVHMYPDGRVVKSDNMD